jgi:TatD DNase family protein
MTVLADTHCHLCLEAFRDDLEPVLERASRAGVRRILVPGIDLTTSRRAVTLAESHDVVFAAVGLHPHAASEWGPSAYHELRALAQSPRVVAIGETGLDFYRNYAPRDRQMAAFDQQLELADELALPVVVHSRESMPEVLDRLTRWAGAERPRAGVLHAFSGDTSDASRALEAGFYIGVAGPVTYPSAHALRSLAAGLPSDRWLVETDAPFLPPVPHRGERNEPAHVLLVAEALASARIIEPGDAGQASWDNAAALFRWIDGTDDRHVL